MLFTSSCVTKKYKLARAGPEYQLCRLHHGRGPPPMGGPRSTAYFLARCVDVRYLISWWVSSLNTLCLCYYHMLKLCKSVTYSLPYYFFSLKNILQPYPEQSFNRFQVLLTISLDTYSHSIDLSSSPAPAVFVLLQSYLISVLSLTSFAIFCYIKCLLSLV